MYAYLHSSLLNTSSSSPELLPLPSVLGVCFLLFSNIFMLFLPFLFLAKGLAISLMKTVARIQKVFLLYIKALHSFFTPPLNAHFRLCISCTILLYFLSSLHAVPPLGWCWPSCLYPCAGFSVSNHASVPDCLFLFFPLLLGAFSAFPSPSQASYCPVDPGHILMPLFAQRSNFLPKLLNSGMPFAK